MLAQLFVAFALLIAGLHARRADFTTAVRPILERRCQPCHFPGGKMYQRLPFDRPDTIVKLGEKKLFTRIKDEKDRVVIRSFLAAQKKRVRAAAG